MENVSVKLSNYPNIEKIVNTINEKDKDRMNFILGTKIDNTIINISVTKKSSALGSSYVPISSPNYTVPNTYCISGLIFEKFFEFRFITTCNEDNETVISRIDHNCDGMYISLSVLDKIILDTDKFNDFNTNELLMYEDKEYIEEMAKGLDELISLSKNNIKFNKLLEINIKEFYSLKSNSTIYRFTFQHSNYPTLSASIYYTNDESYKFKVLSGYVSEYILSSRKSLITDKYIHGYNISRDIVKTIEVIKDLRL